MDVIEFRDLCVDFDQVRALRGVSGAVAPARITVVAGPNAAGKSTLLRAALGLLRPNRGEALLRGTPAHTLRPRELAQRAAYVPQRSSTSPGYSVREVIELARFALAPDPARIDEAMRIMELEEIAHRPFGELSVGQQQRVTIGRALAQVADDGALVLDEPTSAMDLRHEALVLDTLRERARRGATVLMTMHDLAAITEIADDLWLLSDGRLEAAGAAAEIATKERLERVFEVAFRSVDPGDGSRLMLPARRRPF